MDEDHVAGEEADVIVIGGGPAGSAVALRLARLDIRVIQLERRVFLNPHSDHFRSGEGLIPRALRELAALDIDIHAAPWALSRVQRVHIRWPDGSRTTDDIGRRGGLVQIDRERFDHHLFCAASERGVDGRQGWRARRLYRDRQGHVAGVVAQPPDGRASRVIRAPVVVDAGGHNALAIRELNLRAQEADGDFFAMSMFFDQVADLDPGVWEMHLFDPHQMIVAQISRLREGVVRCGLGTTQQAMLTAPRYPQAFFWERMQHAPDLARRLARSRMVGRPFVRARIGYRVRQVVFDGLLLVGDAAGYLNPLFGDGILRALVTARHAATTIAAALRDGDCSRSGLAPCARRHATLDRIDWFVKRLILRMYHHPRAINNVGQVRLVRRALFMALLRD